MRKQVIFLIVTFLLIFLSFNYRKELLHKEKGHPYLLMSDSGVVVMAHGGSPQWNQLVKDAVKLLEKRYTVEIAFGMANPVTLKEAIHKLERKGINHIAVVPLFISSYSPIIQQAKYLLGIDTVFPTPPMIMIMDKRLNLYWKLANQLPWWLRVTLNKEKLSRDDIENMIKPYLSDKETIDTFLSLYELRRNLYEDRRKLIKPFKLKSHIYFSRPLDSDTIVAKILMKRIKEISVNPSQEAVILVAHGPNSEENNIKWIKTMEKIAGYIRDNSEKALGGQLGIVLSATVRDDAPEPIYKQARTHLRALVRQLNQNGYRVLVVPLLLASGGIEQGIWKRLEGLQYIPAKRMLLPDTLINMLLLYRVEEAFYGK